MKHILMSRFYDFESGRCNVIYIIPRDKTSPVMLKEEWAETRQRDVSIILVGAVRRTL